jgi:hypothetical protein
MGSFTLLNKSMAMKQNMGNLDRVLRVLVALIIAGLYFTNRLSGVFTVGLLVLAVIFVTTSAAGFCPLYLPFGITTRDDK